MSSIGNKKINIFYRHYNTEKNNLSSKNRPEWFNYENCFTNLLNTIQNCNVKLNVIFDGEYNNNFIKKYEKYFTLYKINIGTDMGSFFETCKIIKEQTLDDDEIIYFLENDYLHDNDWVKKVNEIINNNEYKYISLYDHLDKYIFEDYKDLKSKILVTNNHHWRTTPSTCGSFLITKKLFDLDYDILSTHPDDHSKFIRLNKERNRIVLTPIPGLSTHCSYNLLSPTINWKKINENKYE